MEHFTPASALVGGVLIGVASTLLLWLNGRIAGIRGILDGALTTRSPDGSWRRFFIVGLILGTAIWLAVGPAPSIPRTGFPLILVALAGLLVGFGTSMCSGCTSGHGVCGIARLSGRSLIATITFMVAAMVTVFIVRHLIGLR